MSVHCSDRKTVTLAQLWSILERERKHASLGSSVSTHAECGLDDDPGTLCGTCLSNLAPSGNTLVRLAQSTGGGANALVASRRLLGLLLDQPVYSRAPTSAQGAVQLVDCRMGDLDDL